MALTKVRINQDDVSIRARGQFAKGMIIEIDSELAKDLARFGQVVILPDEESPPPPKPRGLQDGQTKQNLGSITETNGDSGAGDADDSGDSSKPSGNRAARRSRRNAS